MGKEVQLKMATYLHDNYVRYKAALQSNQKIAFLRKMREVLKLQCDDTQLKNGFTRFLKRYDDTKTKLNSTGFGVDPENDDTLDSGWTKKECPYFEILDEVMGTRPNVTPPFVTCSSGVGPIGGGDDFHDQEIGSGVEDTLLPDLNESDGINGDLQPVATTEENGMDSENEEAVVSGFIRGAFKGLGVKKAQTGPRSALGAFAEIMSDKIAKQAEVDREKLEFEKQKYDSQMHGNERSIEIEIMKVNTKKETDMLRLQHEKEIAAQELEDKKEQRKYEMDKEKQQQEFELKKLELQIELEKIKRGM